MVIFFVCLFAVIPQSLGSPTLQVGTNSHFYPYSFRNSNGQAEGFNVDLLNAVAKELKLNIKIKVDEWSVIRSEFEQGKIDILTGMAYSKEREKSYYFSAPYATLHYSLFVRNDSGSHFASLDGLRIAVQRKDIASELLKGNKGIKALIGVDSIASALSLVHEGKADAAYAARMVGLQAISRNKLDKLVIDSNYPDLELKYCFALSKDQFDLLTQINEGIFIVKQKGIYKSIYIKWFGEGELESFHGRIYEFIGYFAVAILAVSLLMFAWISLLRRQVRRQTAELNRQLEENEIARLKLSEQERFFKTLFNDNPDPVWLVDGMRFVDVNRAACITTGYTKEELLSKTILDISPEKQSDGRASGELVADLLRQSADGGIARFEWSHKRKDGTILPVEVTQALIRHQGKSLLFAAWRDLSGKKAAERALRESEFLYRMISENVSDVIWIYDLFINRFTYVSPSIFQLRGFLPEEVMNQGLEDALSPESYRHIQESLHSRLAAFAAGDENARTMIHRVEQRHKDGSMINTEVVSTFLANPGGEVREIIGVTRDITARIKTETDRLEMERRLLLSQKLESLGILAGGIAHDFNNLLTAIMGNLDLVQKRLALGSKERKYVDQSLSATHRAADLTRQILAYSGQGKFIEQDVDLNVFIEGNRTLLEAMIPKNISFRIELTPGIAGIVVDPGQLQQIIVNLLSNAAEAIDDQAGMIVIATGQQNYDEMGLSFSRIDIKPVPGQFVFLEVKDTGCGMSALMLERIFDPFFTTKFTGRGMGMAAVQGIVKGHHGAIFVDSKEHVGTTITVIFPVTAQIHHQGTEETMPEPISQSDHCDLNKGTILVVEDESMVRNLCCDMIEESGFKTYSAADGQEGIDAFSAHADEISCVLLDLSMPVKDGLTVFEAIRQIRPLAKVVLSSGYSEQEATNKFAGKGLSGFIQKPYVMNDLVSILEKAMTATPGSGTILSIGGRQL